MKKNAVTIKQALDQMISDLKLKPGLNQTRIKEKWGEVMGKLIAKHTTAISLKNGKLYIQVDSAPLKQELGYSRDKIKEVFNKELDEPVIKEVFIY